MKGNAKVPFGKEIAIIFNRTHCFENERARRNQEESEVMEIMMTEQEKEIFMPDLRQKEGYVRVVLDEGTVIHKWHRISSLDSVDLLKFYDPETGQCFGIYRPSEMLGCIFEWEMQIAHEEGLIN